jgi:fructose-bisphosphate aldolase, class I
MKPPPFAGARFVIVALDHAQASGHRPGLGRPADLAMRLADAGCDGVIAAPGTARLARRAAPNLPVFLAADVYATSTTPGESGDLEQHAVLWGAHDARALGAAGLKCLWVFGRRDPEAQRASLRALGALLSEARSVGVPVMVEPVLWGADLAPDREHDGRLVADAARMAFELGADLIKVALPDDPGALGEVASGIDVPILAMGGPSADPGPLFARIRAALDVGIRGVALGRNVWQHPHPDRMVRALRALVHDDAPVASALDLLAGGR